MGFCAIINLAFSFELLSLFFCIDEKLGQLSSLSYQHNFTNECVFELQDRLTRLEAAFAIRNVGFGAIYLNYYCSQLYLFCTHLIFLSLDLFFVGL